MEQELTLTNEGGRPRHRVLVLDCDGTLWHGVVGEVGLSGLELNPEFEPGCHYYRFQERVLELQAAGTLLALNSKNNLEDVLEVLRSHPDCLIKEGHLASFRVNWQDKASNLREIADELNLPLESFVFVDDCDSECETVRSQLPSVTVIQVPSIANELPSLLDQTSLGALKV